MYLLDTNVFIQAKNFYYSFDIAPTFWEWLDSQQSKGNIATIQPVYDELVAGEDELAEWAKERKHTSWFLDVSDMNTQSSLKKLSIWTMNSQFKDTAKIEFLSVADYILVAKAISTQSIVVTHESLYDRNIKKKIKIPNVCEAFNITYISTFELLRKLGARF